uniref:Uncharacterized protein n=1 Tax=Eutreptiella gymnastica TaxID=73025 RepID=A0A7S4GER8_9EUGL
MEGVSWRLEGVSWRLEGVQWRLKEGAIHKRAGTTLESRGGWPENRACAKANPVGLVGTGGGASKRMLRHGKGGSWTGAEERSHGLRRVIVGQVGAGGPWRAGGRAGDGRRGGEGEKGQDRRGCGRAPACGCPWACAMGAPGMGGTARKRVGRDGTCSIGAN